MPQDELFGQRPRGNICNRVIASVSCEVPLFESPAFWIPLVGGILESGTQERGNLSYARDRLLRRCAPRNDFLPCFIARGGT
jgi:hypothetical protein